MLPALPASVRRFIGANLTVWHGAWLCVLGGLGLSLLGIYAIDLGAVDSAPRTGAVTMSGLVARQTIYMLIGLLAGALIIVPHYRWVRLVAWPLMWLLIGLLFYFGYSTRHSNVQRGHPVVATPPI